MHFFSYRILSLDFLFVVVVHYICVLFHLPLAESNEWIKK